MLLLAIFLENLSFQHIWWISLDSYFVSHISRKKFIFEKKSSLLEDGSTFKYIIIIMMMIVMARVIVNRILMPSPDCCLLATLLNISPQSVLTITKLYYYSSFLSKLATFLTCHLWFDIFYRPQTQIPKHFIKWVSYSLLNVIAQPQTNLGIVQSLPD